MAYGLVKIEYFNTHIKMLSNLKRRKLHNFPFNSVYCISDVKNCAVYLEYNEVFVVFAEVLSVFRVIFTD